MQYLRDLDKWGTGLGPGRLAIGAAPPSQRCMPTLAMRRARKRAEEERAKGMISKSGEGSTKGKNTLGLEHGAAEAIDLDSKPTLTRPAPYIPFCQVPPWISIWVPNECVLLN